MSSLKDRVLQFIDGQLDAIHKRPGMWGPGIAVELQVLQLLELRSVVLRPALEASNPRTVLDAYDGFVARQFPGAPPEPLSAVLERSGRAAELTSILARFRGEIVREMPPEDVFGAHDLVLRLWLREEIEVPRASTLSSYYDVFRRVLRAVSRPKGTRGRASQAIEDAIDFALADVLVVAAGAEPAHIVLPLDQIGKAGAASVGEGVRRLVAVNEWAAEREAPVGVLEERLEGQGVAQHVAAQALRIMPSMEENLRMVELGGKLAGRAVPVRIQPVHADRMVQVVKRSPALTEFDEIGSVRAVDKDQCSMRLRLHRPMAGVSAVQCWMDDARLVERASRALVDAARIRVVGSRYRDPGSPAMVIVRDIQ
jgi:hypothetical protein